VRADEVVGVLILEIDVDLAEYQRLPAASWAYQSSVSSASAPFA
jgi:hypothetical protein